MNNNEYRPSKQQHKQLICSTVMLWKDQQCVGLTIRLGHD